MRRVARTHTRDNDAQTRAYGRTLASVFDGWLASTAERGVSLSALVARLQQPAQAAFAAAYLRGKRQAFPGSVMTVEDNAWVATRLQENEHYLSDSLASDVNDKLTRQALRYDDPEFVATLRKSFRSRVENLYGGKLWGVTEAGFLAGVRDLRVALKIRRQRALRQEDDEEDDEEQPGDADLALALGLTLAVFLGLMSGRDRPDAPLSPDSPDGETVPLDNLLTPDFAVDVMVSYVTEEDDQVCEACAANAGEYTEDECPIPGDECDGGNNCRCYLETVVDDGQLAEAA